MKVRELFAEPMPGSSHRLLGDAFAIGVHNLRDSRGADLSKEMKTATVSLYDSGGATVVSAAALTLSGTTRMDALYFLRTGANYTVTTAGTYRAVTLVELTDLTTKEWQQQIEILANPT